MYYQLETEFTVSDLIKGLGVGPALPSQLRRNADYFLIRVYYGNVAGNQKSPFEEAVIQFKSKYPDINIIIEAWENKNFRHDASRNEQDCKFSVGW